MKAQENNSLSAVLTPPDVVVQDYLDFMLRAVTETVVETVVETPVVKTPVVKTDSAPVLEETKVESDLLAGRRAPIYARKGTETAPSVREEICADLATAPSISQPAGEEIIAISDTATETALVTESTPPELNPRGANGKPQWAQAPFECLLFQVAGLKLAAALVELGGIARMTDDLTPIFGQSDWFMGLLRWNDRNIRVIDTARLIMPERLPPVSDGQRPVYEFVLMIEGTDWGLGIDNATEAMHLNPAEVRWRTSLQTRPWLAGTVLDKLCALLDMNAIACRLQSDQIGLNAGNAS